MSTDDLYSRFGREFPKGHVLFQDHDSGREMFVIQAGKVRISKTMRDVEKTLIVLGPGEFFGEMSILNNQPRSATATVEEDAKLLVINPKVFEAMVRGNAEIAVRMIKKLAARLQETNEQVENLLLRDHNSKVVHFLASAAAKLKATDSGVLIDITVEEMAKNIGLDVEPVREVIAKISRAKLVTTTSQGITVKNEAKLREFLNFLEMKEKFGDV